MYHSKQAALLLSLFTSFSLGIGHRTSVFCPLKCLGLLQQFVVVTHPHSWCCIQLWLYIFVTLQHYNPLLQFGFIHVAQGRQYFFYVRVGGCCKSRLFVVNNCYFSIGASSSQGWLATCAKIPLPTKTNLRFRTAFKSLCFSNMAWRHVTPTRSVINLVRKENPISYLFHHVECV